MLYIIGTLRHRVPIASENALQCPHRLKHQKGRKRAEIARKCSALPCNVSCAVAQCRRAYSCKKIGRGIPARFLRFTNFHRCFCLCKYPQTPSIVGGSGSCLGSPLKSQHRAFLAVYGGHSFGFSMGDITLPSSFSKQHSV